MTETVLDLARCLLVAMPAAWLTLGVLDNIRYPAINRDDVGRVLSMAALDDHPEVAALVGHRRITHPAAVIWCFRLIVFGELLATLLLWCAVAALAADALGVAEFAFARPLAIVAMLAFTGVWAAFLIGGQWFYYWYGPHGQATHMLATLWGIGTIAVLAL